MSGLFHVLGIFPHSLAILGLAVLWPLLVARGPFAVHGAGPPGSRRPGGAVWTLPLYAWGLANVLLLLDFLQARACPCGEVIRAEFETRLVASATCLASILVIVAATTALAGMPRSRIPRVPWPALTAVVTVILDWFFAFRAVWSV